MKRLLGALFGIFAFWELIFGLSNANAVTYQPTALGNVYVGISSGTQVDIMNSSAPAVGYLRWCVTCGAAGAAGTLCISTGTSAFQWILSTGTRCQ